jgi:hypothetical protein
MKTLKQIGGGGGTLQTKKFSLLAIALIAFIGFSFTACGDSAGGGGGSSAAATSPLTYTGTASGTKYTLKITESGARAAKTGDGYELTNGSKTSAGTISNITGSGGNYTYTFKPSNSATTYTVTVTQNNGINGMSGTITWTDNTTNSAPSTLSGGKSSGGISYTIENTSGRLTLTGIPSEYNGKYAMAVGIADSDASFFLALSVISASNATLSRISGGSVTMSVWKCSGNDTYVKLGNYTGNDKNATFFVGVYDMEKGELTLLETKDDDDFDDDIAAVGLGSVSFSGGRGTASVTGGDWMFF